MDAGYFSAVCGGALGIPSLLGNEASWGWVHLRPSTSCTRARTWVLVLYVTSKSSPSPPDPETPLCLSLRCLVWRSLLVHLWAHRLLPSSCWLTSSPAHQEQGTFRWRITKLSWPNFSAWGSEEGGAVSKSHSHKVQRWLGTLQR